MIRSIPMILVLAFFGCAGPQTVKCYDHGSNLYTFERPVEPFHVTVGQGMYNAWFADGGPTVLTLHNPTNQFRQAHVSCNPSVDANYIDRGHIEWWTCMSPHTEKRRLVEFMNVDALSQVCVVDVDYQSSPEFCYEHNE